MDPAEPDSQTMLIVDASGSMAYRGRQALSKFEYARQVAASLAKRHLGWQPKVALEDGLPRTIAYFDELLRSS